LHRKPAVLPTDIVWAPWSPRHARRKAELRVRRFYDRGSSTQTLAEQERQKLRKLLMAGAASAPAAAADASYFDGLRNRMRKADRARA